MVHFEDGKKFWIHPNGDLSRMHDDQFKGMKFTYKRCPFCDRITCKATLHWLNHLEKCAPKKYSVSELLELRYKNVSELDAGRYNYDWQRAE